MIQLKPGDIFCTANPMALGRAINFFQKVWATDNDSEYSHAGIIINPQGDTFESLWTVRFSNLSKYIGKHVLIGRPVNLEVSDIKYGLRNVIMDHKGQIYPVWRLPLAIVPPLAKYISSGRFPVCSELVAKYLKLAGVLGIGRWQGKNPDNIADMIKRWDAFEVVHETKNFEGV